MKAFKTLLVSSAVTMALGLSSAVAHEHNHANMQSSSKSTSVAKEASEHEKLFALFAAADQRDIELNPIMAIFRGDMRYADRMGDFLTDSHALAGKTATLLNLSSILSVVMPMYLILSILNL